MGAIRKGFYHQKQFHGSSFLEAVATQHVSWEVVFTHRNELVQDSWEPWRLRNTSWERFFEVMNDKKGLGGRGFPVF